MKGINTKKLRFAAKKASLRNTILIQLALWVFIESFSIVNRMIIRSNAHRTHTLRNSDDFYVFRPLLCVYVWQPKIFFDRCISIVVHGNTPLSGSTFGALVFFLLVWRSCVCDCSRENDSRYAIVFRAFEASAPLRLRVTVVTKCVLPSCAHAHYVFLLSSMCIFRVLYLAPWTSLAYIFRLGLFSQPTQHHVTCYVVRCRCFCGCCSISCMLAYDVALCWMRFWWGWLGEVVCGLLDIFFWIFQFFAYAAEAWLFVDIIVHPMVWLIARQVRIHSEEPSSYEIYKTYPPNCNVALPMHCNVKHSFCMPCWHLVCEWAYK